MVLRWWFCGGKVEKTRGNNKLGIMSAPERSAPHDLITVVEVAVVVGMMWRQWWENTGLGRRLGGAELLRQVCVALLDDPIAPHLHAMHGSGGIAHGSGEGSGSARGRRVEGRVSGNSGGGKWGQSGWQAQPTNLKKKRTPLHGG
jgi:hypothetical protein